MNLQRAHAYCEGVTRSRAANFYYGIRLLPPDRRRGLCAVYAMARRVDDIGDGELSGDQKLALLGHKSKSTEIVDVMLSSGVRLISKPSALNVPPWQLVSARLGGVPLRAATWWANPAIPSTSATTKIGCWSPSLGTPGPVQIATSGKWQGKPIDLRGGSGNHGKIGVSLTGRYTIFGDMNQQGALSGKCASSQNGRGGMFFILEDQALHDSVAALIDGNSAPVAPD